MAFFVLEKSSIPPTMAALRAEDAKRFKKAGQSKPLILTEKKKAENAK